MWKVPGKTDSPYYKRLKKVVETTSKGRYWLGHTEIFARAFEVYVSTEISLMNITNHLLVHTKYTNSVYLKSIEIKALKPKFDRLISLIRKGVK
jgi:hypothetical protein